MQCTLSWCTSTAACGVLFTQSPRQLVPAPYKRLIRKAIWALIHIHWERKIYSINSPRLREEEDLGVWNLLWRHLIQWGADFVTSAASFVASPMCCCSWSGSSSRLVIWGCCNSITIRSWGLYLAGRGCATGRKLPCLRMGCVLSWNGW